MDERNSSPRAGSGRALYWFAGRTRARAEKAVVRALEAAGFEAYLPLIERERQWADRVKRVLFPLFPGYVFLRAQAADLSAVRRLPGLVDVVSVEGRPSPVPEEELNSVRALVAGVNATGVLPSPSDFLEPGDPVEVVEGPFAGMKGVLIEERGSTRVSVKLTTIRQALAVELERSRLRPQTGP